MNNYIDFHSHILYGIDDGAKNIDEAKEIINKLVNIGFTKIVLTPHYRDPYFADNTKKEEIFKELKKELNNINIDLYLANEVTITSNIMDLIKEDKIKLLGNYLFLELPFTSRIHRLDRVVYELQEKGLNIILVHPERYSYLKKEDYEKLRDADVMFQVNYESIIGKYGFDAKKKVKYLYKNNMVDIISTDIHHKDSTFYNNFNKIEKKIKSIISEDKYKDLTYNNMEKIIDEIQ